ncbi:MAG: tetratricopeptide repeat protein [Saprospiraceae bacterium]
MYTSKGLTFSLQILCLFILNISSIIVAKGQEPLQISDEENKIQEAFLSARLESASGHYDSALKILDSLARKHRDRASIYYEMGLLFMEQKNYLKAEEKLQRALVLDQNNFWFLDRMATVQTELSHLDKAIECYQKILLNFPKSSKYYDITADLLLLSNRSAEAVDLLKEKEKQSGFNENNSLKIIEISMDEKSYDIAIVEVEKLITRKNPKLMHLKLAADIYKIVGDESKVDTLHEKILVLDPNDVQAMLSKMDKENGTVDETSYLISLQPLMSNRSIPSEHKVKELLPFVEAHAKNPMTPFGPSLINLCEILANTHPNDPRVHAMFGDVLMNDKKEVQAIRQYQRTLEINKSNFLVWEQLMYGLEYIKDYNTLGETALEAINYFPNQAIAYYFAGVANLQQSHVKSAKEFAEEATIISGKNPVILSRVYLLNSMIAHHEKQSTEALKWVESAISTSNGLLGIAIEWKGDLLLEKGNSTEARSLFIKALELLPNSKTLPNKIALLP